MIAEADPHSELVGRAVDTGPVTPAASAPVDEMTEQDVNGAAVAAYRKSMQSGKPLSERKLAAMFGKTSRRWARSRMTEARQTSEVPDVYQDGPSVDHKYRPQRSAWEDPIVMEAVSAR